MFSIMELLSIEKSLYLIWNSIVWIISKVWRDLVCRCEGGGAGPAGDVENLLIRGLLSHLNWIDRSH